MDVCEKKKRERRGFSPRRGCERFYYNHEKLIYNLLLSEATNDQAWQKEHNLPPTHPRALHDI